MERLEETKVRYDEHGSWKGRNPIHAYVEEDEVNAFA